MQLEIAAKHFFPSVVSMKLSLQAAHESAEMALVLQLAMLIESALAVEQVLALRYLEVAQRVHWTLVDLLS
jgi:hypothetical protein